MAFEANYHGTCAECGEHIAPGMRVEYRGDGASRELVHANGCEIPEPVVGEVCTVCFMQKSLAGTCACVA